MMLTDLGKGSQGHNCTFNVIKYICTVLCIEDTEILYFSDPK